MSEKKNFLNDIKTLSKQEIQVNEISHENLWLVQYDLETKGPFHVDDLNQLTGQYSEELAKSMACNLKAKNWKPFFEHPQFQKRKKQSQKPVLKNEEKGRSSFHVLINGQKKGPYTSSKIIELLDNKELGMNNLLSADNGKSWRKIYHFSQFDRRKHVDIDISVGTPDEDHFEKSKVYTTQLLKKLNLKKNEESLEDALLACQTHLHKKKNKEDIGDKLSQQYLSSKRLNFSKDFPKFNFDKKNAPKALLAGLAIIVLILFIFDDGSVNNKTERRQAKDEQIEEKRENKRRRPTTSSKRKRSKYSSRDRKRRRSRIDNGDLEVDRNASRRDRYPADNDYDVEPPMEEDRRPRRRGRRNQPEEDLAEEDYREDDRFPGSDDDLDPILDAEGNNLIDEDIDGNFANDNEFDDGFEGDDI